MAELSEQQRIGIAEFLRSAGRYALEDGLLMLEEGKMRGGFEIIVMRPDDIDEMQAGLEAEAAGRWLMLAGRVHERRIWWAEPVDVSALDWELCVALSEAVGSTYERWRDLMNLGLLHKHGMDRTRVDGWIFDRLQADVAKGRALLESIGLVAEHPKDWEDWPGEREQYLSDEDVVYLGSDAGMEWAEAPEGPGSIELETRWRGAVVRRG